jgi:hypothetical protein
MTADENTPDSSDDREESTPDSRMNGETESVTEDLAESPDDEDLAGDSDILGPVDVWTPAIDRLLRRVSYLIRLDIPGATFWGVQRVGKSHGLTYLISELPSLFGGRLACVRINADKIKKGESFWKSLMRLLKIPIHYQTESGKNEVVQHLTDTAAAVGSSRILIAVDEANRLLDEHYAILVTIFNELEEMGLRPFMMLIGQPQLATLHPTTPSISNLQDVGRFFNVVEEILPIRVHEIDAVLEALDSVSDLSSQHGARNLLPELYETGFNLKHLAPPIKNAISQLTITSKFQVRISMQYLRSLVVALLIKLYRKEVKISDINHIIVIKILTDIGFLRVMVAYAEKEQS